MIKEVVGDQAARVAAVEAGLAALQVRVIQQGQPSSPTFITPVPTSGGEGPAQQIAVANGAGGFVFDPEFIWTGSKLGVGVATPYVNSIAHFHYSTNQNLVIGDKVALADGVTIRSFDDAAAVQKGLEFRANPIEFGLSTASIGFFGATPVVKQTLTSYTPNSQSSSYTGLATGSAGTPYAAVADLNSLRVAYENLRLAYDDLRSKLQTTTFLG